MDGFCVDVQSSCLHSLHYKRFRAMRSPPDERLSSLLPTPASTRVQASDNLHARGEVVRGSASRLHTASGHGNAQYQRWRRRPSTASNSSLEAIDPKATRRVPNRKNGGTRLDPTPRGE